MDSGGEFERSTRDATGVDTDVMRQLGNRLQAEGDLDGAAAWYRRAAERGDASSMSNLGFILKERGDLEGAEAWYRRAAERDNAYAMSNLGLLLAERGDLLGAEAWYERAADMGNTGAMHNLGSMLKAAGEFDGAESWFQSAVDGGGTASMIDLGLLRQDRGDLAGARAWYERAAEGGVQEGATSLAALQRKIDADAELASVTFDAFGWPLSRNRLRYRQWRSESAALSVRYIGGPSDFRSWNAQEIRADFLERLDFVASPTRSAQDPEFPTWFGSHRPAEMPEQISLLEVECFEIPPAKCVLAMYRHRMRGAVIYSTGIFVLFDACFWLVRLELEEAHRIGAREGAVARHALEDHVAADIPRDTFDPYERRWDGLIPIEDDPLTHMRLLVVKLRHSIRLDDRLAHLDPFDPQG